MHPFTLNEGAHFFARRTARVLTQTISSEICRSMETCGNE
nr:MAG TPA_asm: hypothetical protein [Caudoviricetes sp.]